MLTIVNRYPAALADLWIGLVGKQDGLRDYGGMVDSVLARNGLRNTTGIFIIVLEGL